MTTENSITDDVFLQWVLEKRHLLEDVITGRAYIRLRNNPNDPLKEFKHAPSFLLTEEKAANFIGISPTFLRKMRIEGIGPQYIRFSSKKIMYYKGNIQSWIEDRFVNSVVERDITRSNNVYTTELEEFIGPQGEWP